MWLLDVNIPSQIKETLATFGLESKTSIEMGWRELINGDLVKAAAENDFTCLLTRDKAFIKSAAKSLKIFPHLAVVIITIEQMKKEAYVAEFLSAWELQSIQPKPGTAVLWPT